MKKLLASVAVIIGLTAQANAAKIEFRQEGTALIGTVTGVLKEGDFNKFAAKYNDIEGELSDLEFNSTGGDWMEAAHFADYFNNRNNVRMIVNNGAECRGSCFFILGNATKKRVGETAVIEMYGRNKMPTVDIVPGPMAGMGILLLSAKTFSNHRVPNSIVGKLLDDNVTNYILTKDELEAMGTIVFELEEADCSKDGSKCGD